MRAQLMNGIHVFARFCRSLCAKTCKGVCWLWSALVGQVLWKAPTWVLWLKSIAIKLIGWIRIHPKQTAGILAVALLIFGGGWRGWVWYSNLPKPHMVSYTVKPPAVTDYEKEPIIIANLEIQFAESVAPLEQIGKSIADPSLIAIKPSVEGTWSWASDRVLRFSPKKDWPIGQLYEISLAKKKLFTAGVLLEKYDPAFTTAKFEGNIVRSELYQDPSDPTLKQMVSTATFTHPVDEESVRKNIDIILGDGLKYRDGQPDGKPFVLTFDKTKLNAYIRSLPLAVPLESTNITLKLGKDIHTSKDDESLAHELSGSIMVTGRYRLTFDSVRIEFVNNDQDEPEQVLMFDSSNAIDDEKIKTKVHAWLLPKENTENHSKYWSNQDITEKILDQAESIPLTHIASVEPQNTHHAFKLKAPVNRYIYVKIDAGVEAIGGYLAKNPTPNMLYTQKYPRTIKLLGEGALLSLTGEKKLGYMARGVPGVNAEIARILPDQLHHLVDQNSGTFASPSLSDGDFDRLVERMQLTKTIIGDDPSKTVYDNIDLSSYLDGQTKKNGIFVIKLTPSDKKNETTFNDYSSDVKDLRFVLVTDIGIIVKKSINGNQDVFVESISTGKPIQNARVDVLGRNGLPVFSTETDSEGLASFPKLSELKREKAALMYVVSSGDDMSFLPIDRRRSLNFSRFDIGGLSSAGAVDELTSYLFTDRGLYRPGETVHIASITRTTNWLGKLEGLPLELQVIDPRGVIISNNKINLSESGFESIDYKINETAVTGNYQTFLYLIKNNNEHVQIGTTSFNVRDFEPDRMKVVTTLSDTPVEGWISPEKVNAIVNAQQLFGAPAASRRVTADMNLNAVFPNFPKYPDYRFRINDIVKEPFEEALPETKTDDVGEAHLELDLKRFAHSTYRLHILAKVFEANSGRNVAAESTALVSSAPYLIGVKTPDELDYISKDGVRKISWLAIDPSLTPIAVDKLSLDLIEYRYVSVLVKQQNGTYKFESRRKEITRESKPFSISEKGAELTLPTNEPGDFAYVVKDAQGIQLNQVAFNVVGDANLSRALDRNSELQLHLDKKNYSSGETISINIRAPYTGSGLITIEKDKVYAHAWFKTDATSSIQTITVPEGLEGNAYVNVQFMRDPSSSEIYTSPLSYGIAPFSINLDKRKLPLDIKVNSVVKPGDNLPINISTNGEAAKVVVFAVDEGILQVARYKAPDPLGFFFQKHALEVDTSQILDLILPEFSQLMANAPGGDGDNLLGRHLNPFKRKHLPPVAYWSSIVDLPADGKTFVYHVPEHFNGKLHIFAVAVTQDRIGVSENTTEVRGPFVISPNVPLFVAPNDAFTVSASIFNNLPTKTKIKVSLATDKGITDTSEPAQEVEIASQQEAVVTFNLKATTHLGSSDLKFVAQSNKNIVKLTETVSVRPAIAHRTQITAGSFDGDSINIPITRTLHEELRKVSVGLDTTPIVWSHGLTDYLDNYGYTCTEQLVSKAFPTLVFASQDAIDSGKADILNYTISVLRERQNEQGGFGLWAANPVIESAFASTYAADFLFEAKDRGYPVPTDLINKSRNYLQQEANSPHEGMDELRTQAYAIYLLTRQGIVTTSSIAAITEQLDSYHKDEWKKDITAAYLAATYKLLKQDAMAHNLLKAVAWQDPTNEKQTYYLYDDALTHDGKLITLIAKHFPEKIDEIPNEVLTQLGNSISHNRYNSLSAATLIRALDNYGRRASESTTTLTTRALMKDKQNLLLSMIGKPPRAAVPISTDSIQFNKSGSLPAFYLLSETGFDISVPQTELKQGLEITRELTTLDGQPLKQVKVGDEFLVNVKLRAMDREQVDQIAIVDLLPGGTEPVFTAPAETDSNSDVGNVDDNAQVTWQSPIGEWTSSSWHPDYVDIRDDRLVFYGYATRDVKTFIYRIRATNVGTYQLPPPYVEGMYDTTLQGRGLGGQLMIINP